MHGSTYQQVLKIVWCMCAASVDGLVEASRQSRVCGGAANEVMCAVFRVLMEVRSSQPCFAHTSSPWPE